MSMARRGAPLLRRRPGPGRPPLATAGRSRSCLRTAGRAPGRRGSRARPERCVHLFIIVRRAGSRKCAPPPAPCRALSIPPRSSAGPAPATLLRSMAARRSPQELLQARPPTERAAAAGDRAARVVHGRGHRADGRHDRERERGSRAGTKTYVVVIVRVRAHVCACAGRPLFVLSRPWRPPRAGASHHHTNWQLCSTHPRRASDSLTSPAPLLRRSTAVLRSPQELLQVRPGTELAGSGPHLFVVATQSDTQSFRSSGGRYD